MNPLLSESSLVNSSLHKEFHDHGKKKHVEDDDGDEDDGDEDEEDDGVKNVDDEERWRPDLLLGLSTTVKSVPELGELGLIDSLVSVLVGLP